MLVCPFAFRVMRKRYVIGWRELPSVALPQPESEIFRMIVAVAAHDVEYHPAERFFHVFIRQVELADRREELRISVGGLFLVIDMVQGAQGLYVVPHIIRGTVKALGHKMRAP